MRTANELPLRTGLEEFTQTYMPAKNLAPRTRNEYQRDLADLVRFLAQRGLTIWQQVNLTDLEYYLAELDQRQLKPASRSRKTYAIKTFFNYLTTFHYLDEQSGNPALKLIPPKVPKQERRFLQQEEYQALLAQARDPRDRAILEMLLQTGLRLSEVAALTTADLAHLPKRITKDLENVGLVKVTRKGATEAYIPLNWKACEALKAWLKVRQTKVTEKDLTTDALWLSKFDRPLSARAIRYLVKKYLQQAGISDASVHTLRHTTATHYLAKGGDLRSVQALLGHERIETTQIYLGLAKKVQRKMVQELAL